MRKNKKKIILVFTSIAILILIILPILSNIKKNLVNKNNNIQKETINNVTKNNKYNNEYGVSVSNEIAANVGMDILEQGGNAVDASIAIAYTLGVVEPYASGIGGGGGMLIHSTESEEFKFYNYREMAPPTQTDKSSEIGIPGFVKGMEVIHKDYGTMELSNLIEPAIYYANEGFKMDRSLYTRLKKSKYRLDAQNIDIFYQDEEPIKIGKKIIQRELANTLTKIKEQGSDAFYFGEIAKEIEKKTNITIEDLKQYDVKKQEPIVGEYHEYEIMSAPPPFSGITLIQMLKLAEVNELSYVNIEDRNYINEMKEIIDITYKDRAKQIGDPSFYKSNYNRLVSDKYIGELQGVYKNYKYTDIEAIKEEHESTTHFTVIDKYGMMVSCTNTLSNFWGSGTYINGFFMNSTLSNFSDKEGYINSYEPGKRPRTFTSPTIIKNEENILAIGSSGGNRIPQILSRVIIDNICSEVDIQDAINKPRIIIEENKVFKEEDFDLKDNKDRVYYGSVQATGYNKYTGIYGGSDERRPGKFIKKGDIYN